MTALHRSRLAGLVAATLVAATGLVGLTTTPAGAAFCSGSGVNVVVDFGALGGGVQKSCDPSGAGKPGQQVFPAAGFKLGYLQAGYVCQVSNRPANGEPCQAIDAYWGLFWSDGKSGRWTYATQGVGGQSAPEGGFLAFAWQGSDARRQPATSPKNAAATPTKTPTPTTPPTPKPEPTRTPKPAEAATKQPAGKPGGAAKPNSAAALTATTETRTTSPARAKSKLTAAVGGSTSSPTAAVEASEPSTSVTLEPTEDASPSPQSAKNASSDFSPDDEQSGLPTWIPVTVVLGLALAACGGLWWRSRAGTP